MNNIKTDFIKINNRLDEQIKKLESIDKHLAVYNSQLKTHIKRTEILEQKIEPLENFKEQVKGAVKLLSLLAGLSTIATLIYYFIGV